MTPIVVQRLERAVSRRGRRSDGRGGRRHRQRVLRRHRRAHGGVSVHAAARAGGAQAGIGGGCDVIDSSPRGRVARAGAWPVERASLRANPALRRVEPDAVARGRPGSRPGPGSRRLPGPSHQRRRPPVRRELGRLAPDAAGASVPRPRRALHLSRPAAPADLGREGSRNAAGHRDQELHQHLRADADDLDGRPSASVSVRAAHVHGLLDRRVGRRHAHGHDHAPQAGLAPPQRRPRKRSDDGGRALHPARQVLHARRRHFRPGLSRRADDPVDRLSASPSTTTARWLWPCEYVEEISGKSKSRRAASPAGREPVHQGVPRSDARARNARRGGGPETIYPDYLAQSERRSERRH